MTASEIKEALRRRHPALDQFGGPGPWTCLEEWRNIDLIAFASWTQPKPARCRHAIIAYEVKVARGDMRTELLNPRKRSWAVRHSNEFYFAVPKGLLTADEIAWQEPEWSGVDFRRLLCPDLCRRPLYGTGRKTGRIERAHGPATKYGEHPAVWAMCETCGGTGYMEKSRVEQESPTLWVPRDSGLLEVSGGGRCTVVRKAPLNRDPEHCVLGDLVRWASYRGDPRHRSTRTDEVARTQQTLFADGAAA